IPCELSCWIVAIATAPRHPGPQPRRCRSRTLPRLEVSAIRESRGCTLLLGALRLGGVEQRGAVLGVVGGAAAQERATEGEVAVAGHAVPPLAIHGAYG